MYVKYLNIVYKYITWNLRGGKPMDTKRSQPIGIELVKRGIASEADID